MVEKNKAHATVDIYPNNVFTIEIGRWTDSTIKNILHVLQHVQGEHRGAFYPLFYARARMKGQLFGFL